MDLHLHRVHFLVVIENICFRAFVLTYNIPGVTNLVLTREQIVGIYNGSINTWSHPTFVEHNPGIELPNATILPVARFESSGSTETFTMALSSFSYEWATGYGVFSERTGWNASVVTLFAQRNSGMVDMISREPYRIGYVTPVHAIEVHLPFASIINHQGRVTVPDKSSLQATMDQRLDDMSSRLTSSLVDCEDERAYPIAGYSYFIVHMTQEGNCTVTVELARYVEWFLTSVQADAEAHNHLMVQVSPETANRIRLEVLERMTCDGQLVMDLVRQQRYHEEESLKTWKLPVQIVTPLIAFVIILLILYAIQQRVKYLRMLERDDWKINFFEIDFVMPKKRYWVASSEAAPTSSGCWAGRWNVHEVVVRPLSIASVFVVNRKMKQMLMRMRDKIEHENVARFLGISMHNDAIFLVEQYCANGTLVDFFRDNKYSVNQSLTIVGVHQSRSLSFTFSLRKVFAFCPRFWRMTYRLIGMIQTTMLALLRP